MNSIRNQASHLGNPVSYNFGFLLLLILILVSLPACMIQDFATEPVDERFKIKGSGVLITETRDLPFFHSISFNTVGLVTISPGFEQHLEITIDDNIVEYLSLYVENERLIIELNSDITLSEYDLLIEATMTDLKSLATNSAGSIKGLDTFEENKINLVTNSAGNISLDLNATQVNSMINSAGSLFISGRTTYHNSMLSSAGSLSAFELETETTIIMVNSAGSAQVNVSKLLDVTINSIGCVFYKGYPKMIQNINSIGCVISSN